MSDRISGGYIIAPFASPVTSYVLGPRLGVAPHPRSPAAQAILHLGWCQAGAEISTWSKYMDDTSTKPRGESLLLPFSCKRRGFCPSCTVRRMAQTATHLVECVMPWVPNMSASLC